jgi:hypothetical protein
MANKPRTRRMSFILPQKSRESTLDSTLEFLRDSFDAFNASERDSEVKKRETGSRSAPFYISELRCLPADGGTTLCLLHTNGDQFQFTRWYEMLNRALGFVEKMDQESKLKQIADFTTRMRHLDAKSVLRFDVPGTTMKRLIPQDSDSAQTTPTKKLALLIPERSQGLAASRAGSSPSAPILQQTVLTAVTQKSPVGTKQPPLLPGNEDGSSAESLFKPSDDAVGKLINFLVGKYVFFRPSRTFEAKGDKESEDDYRSRVKKQLTLPPVLAKIIANFLPLFLSSKGKIGVLYTMLPAGHVDSLASLQKLFCPVVSWKGVYALYLTADSQELSYGIDWVNGGEMSRKSCYLELWRRALRLEGALAAQCAFFMKIVECVSPPTLTTVSAQTLGNVRALLSSGAGLYSGGAGFWTPRSVDCLRKLKEGGDPKVQEALNWLGENRANAFNALFPFVGELDLLPTLAHIVTLSSDLGNLRDIDAVQRVLKSLSDDRESKMRLYRLCCDWLCLYGGKITW